MNLRTAAGIALLAYGLSLLLPALNFVASTSATSGWNAAVFCGQVSLGTLSSPSSYKGLVLGGATVSDQFFYSACLSGTGANLLFLFGIGCALRRRPTATLLAAGSALAAGGVCLMMLLSDDGFQPLIGIWLWIGSMLWLSSAAAWNVWQTEFGHGPLDAAMPHGRIPA